MSRLEGEGDVAPPPFGEAVDAPRGDGGACDDESADGEEKVDAGPSASAGAALRSLSQEELRCMRCRPGSAMRDQMDDADAADEEVDGELPLNVRGRRWP